MSKYVDVDKLKEMIEAKADTLIEGKQAFNYVAKWLDLLPSTDIKADTVRKMQERLKAQKFTHKNFGELVYVEDIDQIANELLEGSDET